MEGKHYHLLPNRGIAWFWLVMAILAITVPTGIFQFYIEQEKTRQAEIKAEVQKEKNALLQQEFEFLRKLSEQIEEGSKKKEELKEKLLEELKKSLGESPQGQPLIYSL